MMPALWATDSSILTTDYSAALAVALGLTLAIIGWFVRHVIKENGKAHDRLGSDISRIEAEMKKEVREVRAEVKEVGDIVRRIEGATWPNIPPVNKAPFGRTAVQPTREEEE